MGEPPKAARVNHRAVTVSLSLEEHAMWQELNSRLRRLDVAANNSTPSRAGLRLLSSLGDAELERIVRDTPVIPKGPRPKD
jgi:hypothetical protein